jgi:aspartate-semialdehyde dehydrogenase
MEMILPYVTHYKNKKEKYMSYNVAIIGASGVVGHEILNVLSQTQFPIKTLAPLTSTKMSGREMSFGDIDVKTQGMDNFDYSGLDILFVTGVLKDAKDIIATALKAGAKVIDCTGATSLGDPRDNLVSMPSSISSQMIAALKPLQIHAKIKRIVVSTYQAVSVEGKDGMDELFNQSRKFFVTDGLENDVFRKQISFNVIPQIDQFMDDGQTQAEWTLSAEIKRHLDKDIKTSATCVVVPTFIGHGASINVEFDNDMDAKTAKSLWRDEDGIIVIDEASEMEFVTPADTAGEDSVFISRLRNDSTLDNGISFWCVADNIRASLALRAVNIARDMLAT